MAAYWLTFKPRSATAPRGWPIDYLRALVSRFRADPANTKEWWRIAAHKAAHVGDRVYAFKQGANPRGIFGVGTIVDGPRLKESPLDGLRYRALIHFDQLVDPTKTFLLTLAEIKDLVSPNLVDSQASGISVPDGTFLGLERRLARK